MQTRKPLRAYQGSHKTRAKPSRAVARKGRTEEALRESENKFRDLAEKSIVGIYLIQDGKFKYVNPRFAEIFGYEVWEIMGRMAPRELILHEDVAMVEENIRKRISGEAKSFHYEFRGITRNGETIHVEVYSSQTTFLGRPALIGSLLDITERKRAEELIRQAEEKYRAIFENAVEGIFQSTPSGQLIEANPALARIMGYDTAADFIAAITDLDHQIYVHPEQRREFMRALARKGIVLGFESEHYKKDGTKIWVSMNARAVRDANNATLYYEGIIDDITEKKKAENELRLLNEFNETIIHNAPVAIFILRKDGVITSVNPALASLSGLGSRAAEKLIGLNWLQNAYTIKCGLATYIEQGLRGEPFQLWDFPFITYRGDRNLYMDFKGVPLRGKEGDITGLLCIIEETTDRVKARAMLMQEAKMSFIGKLAAGIAHELNNPLATLVAYTELAGKFLRSRREYKGQGPDLQELTGYLDTIEQEAFRCKTVVNDILSLSRKEGFEITGIDINSLLDRLLKLMSMGRPNVKITRELSPSLPFVRGDLGGLRQVFMNLTKNAMDAVQGRMDATIWIRTSADTSNLVSVEVRDNGIGIPDSIIDKIFEPFFTTKESQQGMGLGLSLCRELLNNMGGTVKVVSKPGVGTSFFVALPTEFTENRGGKIRDDSRSNR